MAEGEPGNPDAIYAYDPVLVGERGARAAPARARTAGCGEPDALEAALAQAGVPVAARLEAPGTIDGGDTLWLDETRSSSAAATARTPPASSSCRRRSRTPRCSPTTCRTGTAAPR